jgi:sugar phosphate isomerase/epimerase
MNMFQEGSTIEKSSRREFLRRLGLATAGLSGVASAAFATDSLASPPEMFFKISLAEWSYNRSLYGGKMTNLDFPVKARKDFDIGAIEYVNVFFKDKAKDQSYLNDLKQRCQDNSVQSVLIMCDGEGDLGDLELSKRMQAVENHYKWVDAAHFLGCHSIRVNCYGTGTKEEVGKSGVEGLSRLSEYAAKAGLNILLENHDGYSWDAKWVSHIVRSVGMANCGTLPDFENFTADNKIWQDRYEGVKEMMPFAKGVSAKAINFDKDGNCVETDYARMLAIVKASGYSGYLGIEFEGTAMSEEEGIRATKKLLERVGGSLK